MDSDYNKGSLAAYELYEALCEPRSSSGDHEGKETLYGSNGQLSQDIARSNRRRIFIANIDSDHICSIMAAAPPYQVKALRSMIYKYLSSVSWVAAPERGSGNPQYSLHIPYRALRKSYTLMMDRRLKVNGRPFRGYQDISFLDANSPYRSFLYEAQCSFVLVGFDKSTWVSYYFEDSYFDTKPGSDFIAGYGGSETGHHVSLRRLDVDRLTAGLDITTEEALDPKQ